MWTADAASQERSTFKCVTHATAARLQRPLRHPFSLAPDSTTASLDPTAGNPAVFLRKLKPEETAFLGESAEHYARLAAEHAQVGPPAVGSCCGAAGLLGMRVAVLVQTRSEGRWHWVGSTAGTAGKDACVEHGPFHFASKHPTPALAQETSKPLEQIAAEKGLAA